MACWQSHDDWTQSMKACCEGLSLEQALAARGAPAAEPDPPLRRRSLKMLERSRVLAAREKMRLEREREALGQGQTPLEKEEIEYHPRVLTRA